MATSVTTNPTQTLEPPHSWEIHVKKQLFVLRSQLHRIPEKFIDVDIQPKKGITLSTTRFTKKYHVTIPFPKTITVGNPEDAESILDGRGILTVRIPLKRISASLLKEREQSMKVNKPSREATQELKTRTRDIFLGKRPEVHQEKTGDKSENKTKKTKLEKSASKKQQPREKSPLVTDDDMMSMSKEYGSKAAKKQAEHEKRQKELQEQHQKAIEKRLIRKEKKSDFVLNAFNRVLEEKKANLQRMIGEVHGQGAKKVSFQK